ncbi:MAG: flagellar biosynthesis protein FliQ [Oceanococcus sp.]
MTPDSVMTLGQQALKLTLMLSAPLLLTALTVGLIVGLFQAATQIQEMTLSFIPKLLAMGLAFLIAGPWMLRILMDFTRQLILDMPTIIG